ncbi:MAG: hypothetical protein JOZ57_11080, partial [Abitibacteriaceae bacterium]|nr:hypothetical protein [Abditibacteriaceae bacterium]
MQKIIGCFGIMNAQARLRTNWLKRGEWNVLLLSAICALLLASPSAGASLAASPLAMSSLSSLSSAGASSQYEAVLWWLQHSAGGTARYARNLGARSHIASLVAAAPVFDTPESSALDAHEVASLLASLQTTDLAHSTGITLPGVSHGNAPHGKVTATHAA